jgi:hypothetical protein
VVLVELQRSAKATTVEQHTQAEPMRVVAVAVQLQQVQTPRVQSVATVARVLGLQHLQAAQT